MVTSLGLGLLVVLGACDEKKKESSAEDKAFEAKLQLALQDAKPGSVIEIPEGVHPMTRSLSLNVDGVTIKGAGMGKSILSFKGAIAGGGVEGLLVHANDFTAVDFAIEDTKGDAIKVNGGTGITFRRVRTEWTGGPKTENGAYGLYPVQCKNVLVEESFVRGSSDAGIYVGQSENIVVRNNVVKENVAGIEIENSHQADVYDNLTTANVGGILVFNMPNLQVPGWGTRVFHNRVIANNTPSFAAKGTAVASVPSGAGIVVNSNKDVEIFDNDVEDNQTANLIISSYFSTGYMTTKGVSEKFDPYPERIAVHGNRFKGGGDSPDGLDLKTLKIALFGLTGHLPDILWDGWVNPATLVDGKMDPQHGICIDNAPAQVLNADGPNKFKEPRLADKTDFVCTLPPLQAAGWEGLPAASATVAGK
jgi:parallel beta-helix repeat protein